MGRIIYTNPDLVYGATSCQRLFRRHGKLRQRILYCSQLTRSLFLAMGRRMVVLQPYAMVCQIQRHPYFFLLCATVYIGSLWLAMQRIFKGYYYIPFLVILSMFTFWSYGVNGIRNGMGASLFILAMTYVNRPPVMIGLCVLAAGIHKSIYLMVGAGTLTWFIKNSYWYLAGWMACVGVSYAIGGRIQAYLAATNLMGETTAFPAI